MSSGSTHGSGGREVAIVGTGPAGAVLAALLAARGVAVTLLDRETFPRDKLCGEFLSYDALPLVERLGVDLTGAPRIGRCRVTARHRTYEFALPHAARGISRLRLDAALVAAARAAGAHVVEGETVSSLEIPRARVVVGAWGRWGRLDAQLGRPFVRDRSRRHFGFKRHYRAIAGQTAGAQDVIELYSFARGYLGVSGVEEGITNICGLVHASRLAGHKGRWETFVDAIRAEEPALDAMYARYEPAQENFLTSEPVIFRARSPVERGVFMIGDASGVIDPLTGNGMAMAIQSALLVAPLVLRLLEREQDRAAIEQEYRARHAAMFASRIAWSRRVAALLSRPGLLDQALRLGAGGTFFLERTRGSRESVARLTDAWFARC